MPSLHRNYVRTYRRRSSLAQQDLAFLLGSQDKVRVCHYERGRRLPSLRTALALAAILGVSVSILFNGVQREVNKDVAGRIARLRAEIQHKYGTGRMPTFVSKRLRWLEDHPVQFGGNQHKPA